MGRRLDPVLTNEINSFRTIIKQYEAERNPEERRRISLEAGKILLQRNKDYWPIPQKWMVGKYGTGEEGKARVAFRALVQAYHRREKKVAKEESNGL